MNIGQTSLFTFQPYLQSVWDDNISNIHSLLVILGGEKHHLAIRIKQSAIRSVKSKQYLADSRTNTCGCEYTALGDLE